MGEKETKRLNKGRPERSEKLQDSERKLAAKHLSVPTLMGWSRAVWVV